LTQQVIETFGRIPTPREFIKACTMVDSAPTMQEAAKAILQNWPEPLTVGDAMSCVTSIGASGSKELQRCFG
jgi:hypothetical protein